MVGVAFPPLCPKCRSPLTSRGFCPACHWTQGPRATFWRLPLRSALHRHLDHLRIGQQQKAIEVVVADPRTVGTPYKTSVTVAGETFVLCIPCENRHRAAQRA